MRHRILSQFGYTIDKATMQWIAEQTRKLADADAYRRSVDYLTDKIASLSQDDYRDMQELIGFCINAFSIEDSIAASKAMAEIIMNRKHNVVLFPEFDENTKG